MNTTHFDAVILDWAGTTIDYGCFAPVAAFQQAFAEFGIQATTAETRAPMGLLKHEHIKTMLQMDRIAQAWQETQGHAPSAQDVDAIYARFEPKMLATVAQFTTLKPDTLQAVAALREQGLAIGSTTGYTDAMMDIVVDKAAQQGYSPDNWVSADSTNGFGRPYPYMIFRNMEMLRLRDVRAIAKVGDTISDIREGNNAGVFTIGVTEGSSLMGLGQEEFDALSPEGRDESRAETRRQFLDAGADAVIDTLAELPDLLA
ncbi:MAG: phosphonoacetaldehyde hydrolase [Bifidobacterium tibiigranuli]|jgi:phosphonoacetaldehyde hydrolase|uniref:phosphonoacetaldehyde hydrolase n=1 Tax=Bifidobacterium tibiigranuli TaxID=2172043 RepID=UPI0026F2FFE3|nr:phosphonoacetaldehyde hydrolase [Bifidobacterium tibiigranuli]MCI1672747.1 phosphonoacetaldehyde hydrolase [Bifidobacterium tibiigranuli]MCI1712248.1 phosphonoacetaldehyde hydrolase [Bifidobacterium tibiigranuli]MCI1833246.1 phosphonoacetaldehyde hydrolase [Bifidobacterium tibiigranuli]